VGTVNIGSRALACPPFIIALRERGPLPYTISAPDQGADRISFLDPEITFLTIVASAPKWKNQLTTCFFGCCFTREVWWHLLHRSGLQQLCPTAEDRMVHWWVSSRKKLQKDSCRGFDSMVVLVWWLVWRERNNRVFNGAMQQATTLANWIREEAAM
jgi:hypothetical protein